MTTPSSWDTFGQAGAGLATGLFGLFGQREQTAARIAEAQIAANANSAQAEIANANARAMFGIAGSQQQQYLIVGVVVLVGLAFIFRARDIRG
ncbi:MAG: hypothetical protein ING29_12500 [Azospirillum sp.]|nr:hypothetical protein [Azospirillum sp.]